MVGCRIAGSTTVLKEAHAHCRTETELRQSPLRRSASIFAILCALITICASQYWATVSFAGTAVAAATASAAAKVDTAGKILPVSASELALLKKLDQAYQQKNAKMSVHKTIKVALLEQERKTQGQLWISKGRLRMELDGSEKTLLVVNKKYLWAITYPPAEFKDSALNVVRADVTSKKGQAQNFVALLTQGGLLKFFSATAVQRESGGNVLFFLSPKQDVSDFKRAQVTVSKDGAKLLELSYWDDRDNETHLYFSDISFTSKADEKLFEYVPPPKTDVMTI